MSQDNHPDPSQAEDQVITDDEVMRRQEILNSGGTPAVRCVEGDSAVSPPETPGRILNEFVAAEKVFHRNQGRDQVPDQIGEPAPDHPTKTSSDGLLDDSASKSPPPQPNRGEDPKIDRPHATTNGKANGEVNGQANGEANGEAKAGASATLESEAEPIPATVTPPPTTRAARRTECKSACVIDGSKLILRLADDRSPFQVDHCLRILFSTSELKRIDKTILFSTYVAERPNTTVVIDAGPGVSRFVPLLPSLTQGVVYTRDGAAHVVLSGTSGVQRSRVSASAMPTRVVNKFASQRYYDRHIEPRKDSIFNDSKPMQSVIDKDVYFPWSDLGFESGQGGVVFVRSDDSMFTTTLSARHGKSELHEGRPLAWSPSVTFQYNSGWCCFKKVTHVLGPGQLWLDNGKAILAQNVVMT